MVATDLLQTSASQASIQEQERGPHGAAIYRKESEGSLLDLAARLPRPSIIDVKVAYFRPISLSVSSLHEVVGRPPECTGSLDVMTLSAGFGLGEHSLSFLRYCSAEWGYWDKRTAGDSILVASRIGDEAEIWAAGATHGFASKGPDEIYRPLVAKFASQTVRVPILDIVLPLDVGVILFILLAHGYSLGMLVSFTGRPDASLIEHNGNGSVGDRVIRLVATGSGIEYVGFCALLPLTTIVLAALARGLVVEGAHIAMAEGLYEFPGSNLRTLAHNTKNAIVDALAGLEPNIWLLIGLSILIQCAVAAFVLVKISVWVRRATHTEQLVRPLDAMD
jgi:hypothetical protein